MIVIYFKDYYEDLTPLLKYFFFISSLSIFILLYESTITCMFMCHDDVTLESQLKTL